jgi:hypothetical protein
MNFPWLTTSRGPSIASGGGSTAFVTAVPFFSTLRNDGGGYTTGFGFTVGSTGITITHLGRWKASGDSASHTMYIYNSAFSILATVSVNMSNASEADGFVYAVLASSLALSASTLYYCGSVETTGVDHFYDYPTQITTTTAATTTGGFYYLGGTSATGLDGAGHSYGPVNFKYT